MTPEGPGHFVGDNPDGEGPDIEDKSQGRFEEAAFSGSIIDDFEDENIDEYSIVDGSSDDFSFVSSPVVNGSKALKISSDGGLKTIVSTSGLDNYPSAGDKFIYTCQFDTQVDPDTYLFFGLESESNPNGDDSNDCYYVYCGFNNSDLQINQIEGSSVNGLASSSANYPSGEYFDVVVDWGSSGTIDVEVIDKGGTSLGNASATDTLLSSGGVGLRGNSRSTGDDILYDFLRIT